MKKILLIIGIASLSACTTIPLSRQGREEADLLGDFVDISLAQRKGRESQFEELQNLLARVPDSVYLKQLLVAQAVADGEASKASPYADFIQAPDPTAEDWRVYGAYQASTGDYSGAISSYENALADDPDNEASWVPYINLLARIAPEKAVEKIEQMAIQNPYSSSELYTEIARFYLYQQNFEKAFTYLNKAVEQDPQNATALLWRSRLYEQSQQYFLMLHDLEELEKIGGASWEEYDRMAAIFLLSQDFERAETYFLKAYHKNPKDPNACYFLSALAEHRQDYEQAITFTRAAADYSTTAGKWVQVSFYQKKLGQSAEMLQTLKEAYHQFEGNVEIGLFYGVALNDEKKYKEAARVLAQVVKTSPDYDEARLQYAYALDSLKRYDEMEKELQVLLTHQPSHAAALNLYAYSLAQRGIRLEEAQNYIGRALLVEPDDISFIDTQAWVLLKQEKWEQAESVFSALSEEEITAHAEIAYHVGYLRWKQGRPEEALHYLKMAKDDWPDAKTLYQTLTK